MRAEAILKKAREVGVIEVHVTLECGDECDIVYIEPGYYALDYHPCRKAEILDRLEGATIMEVIRLED